VVAETHFNAVFDEWIRQHRNDLCDWVRKHWKIEPHPHTHWMYGAKPSDT
jgi:hypothetical protein